MIIGSNQQIDTEITTGYVSDKEISDMAKYLSIIKLAPREYRKMYEFYKPHIDRIHKSITDYIDQIAVLCFNLGISADTLPVCVEIAKPKFLKYNNSKSIFKNEALIIVYPSSSTRSWIYIITCNTIGFKFSEKGRKLIDKIKKRVIDDFESLGTTFPSSIFYHYSNSRDDIEMSEEEMRSINLYLHPLYRQSDLRHRTYTPYLVDIVRALYKYDKVIKKVIKRMLDPLVKNNKPKFKPVSRKIIVQ